MSTRYRLTDDATTVDAHLTPREIRAHLIDAYPDVRGIETAARIIENRLDRDRAGMAQTIARLYISATITIEEEA